LALYVADVIAIANGSWFNHEKYSDAFSL
jgi:hypothetical protein